MESKNIKIVDEHGIDRTANIICSIDVSGSDYIVYAIERDTENDNIFVSKLIKNIDNTSNLMNIEDSMEKENISNLVKQLTLDAVNSNDDVLSNDEVVLSDGKLVKFITSLINKEQNINVQKTYIATVKKSVTKVFIDYYDVKMNIEPKMVEDNDLVIDSIFPTSEGSNKIESLDENVQDSISVKPIIPEVTSVLDEVNEVLEMPSLIEEPKPVVTEEIAPILPVLESKNVDYSLKEKTDNNKKLVFDASKESNLNDAFNEIATDRIVTVESVKPIREFGVEEDLSIKNVEPAPLVRKRKAGFANNKFFMVIAITIFFGACVFLGYEAFRFFQLTK